MEAMVMNWVDPGFWNNKRVFVTGHTGFKGTWLCLWLHSLGAAVTGYSLCPPTQPNLFDLCRMDELIASHVADIRDDKRLSKAIMDSAPDVVFHLAAQPLVRASYESPAESFEVNTMGTVYLLEAVRTASQNGIPIKTVVNVTTDKCYDNQEWAWGYREIDPLGGRDPYSTSKACSELITACYRKAFFEGKETAAPKISIASARAGNVIGGGDWAKDRLIPDIMRALLNGEMFRIRSPQAVRPWQHVLEPLHGYLLLAERLTLSGDLYTGAWNFGPNDDEIQSVQWIADRMCELWGEQALYQIDTGSNHHEALHLRLDSSKAKNRLGWHPQWNLDMTLTKVIDWYTAFLENREVREICFNQIQDYVQGGKPK